MIISSLLFIDNGLPNLTIISYRSSSFIAKSWSSFYILSKIVGTTGTLVINEIIVPPFLISCINLKGCKFKLASPNITQVFSPLTL